MLHTPRAFHHVVTMDESWVYVYDPHLKNQSLTWLRKGEARPQKPRKGIATAKVMIITFFDSKGLIYFEYVQRPNTVNQIYLDFNFDQILSSLPPSQTKGQCGGEVPAPHGQCSSTQRDPHTGLHQAARLDKTPSATLFPRSCAK